ncbi:MAG: PqqD family protein [Floccifex porci]|uniref:PqqD family protein n=1 Tax=Floccifex porci TaxID=2606629 RepID=UPI003EFC9716
MHIKEGFILRRVAGQDVVIPMGDNIADFNGIITLNETAAFLWKNLQQDITKEDLLNCLLQEYEIDREKAAEDLDGLLSVLEERKILEA